MSTGIYDKTTKGRTEIATRQFQLPAKIRTLLVMIDGKRAITELFKQTQGLGLTQENIEYLLDEGFIAELAEPAIEVSPAQADATATAMPADPTPVLAPGAPAPGMDEAKRLQALHNFFNSTIKSTLGLRGFSLQLKAERAASLSEFEALRRPYIEGVFKAKGREMAISLRDRLDQLLFVDTSSERDPIIDDE